MATQYTTILKLALPVTGELSGTWGDTVNNNITSMVEEAVAGLATINSWTANAHTLTTANGTTSESRCAMLVADDDGAGNPSAAAEIICPDATKLYVLKNISGQQVTLKTSAGTGVAVPNNQTAFLFCDGTNVNACVTSIVNGDVSGNLDVGGNLTVDGNTTLGDSSSDTITATARFNTDLLPSTDNARDLGSSGNSWKDLYIDGTAYLALVDINGGAIDGVTLGTNSPVTEAQIDNVNINGNTISSTDTDGDLTLEADGTGNINLNADTVRVGDNNANATVTTNGTGDLILNTNAGTNSGSVTIQDGTNGNIVLTPDGTGEVDISKVDIDSGAIDGTAIGANSASTGKFTSVTDTALTSGRVTFATTNGELTDSANLTFNGTDLTVSGAVNATTVDATNIEVTNIKAKDGTSAGSIADSTGVVTFASTVLTTTDINGGSIDGVTLGTNSAVTEAQIDNININGNSITSTNSNGNIALTPNGTGEVDISKVDIAGGEIDAVTLGTNSAVTEAQIDNINIDGNTISTTDTDGDLILSPDGDGVVQEEVGGTNYNLASQYDIGTAPNQIPLNQYLGDLAYQNAGSIAGPVVIGTQTSSDALRITQTGTGNALVVEDSANPDATPFVVDASGKVLIGNTTSLDANSQFQISSTSAFLPQAAIINQTNDANAGYLKFQKIRASAVVNQNDTLGFVLWTGYDGTNQINSAAISAAVDGTPGTNDMPGRLVFSTTADGASSPTERMRIDNQGRVGIGGTASSFIKVDVSGTLPTGSNVSYAYNIRGTIPSGATTSYLGFLSNPTTEATTFTCGNIVHFQANPQAFGAGSTVTNQFGFFAQSSLTGATNNYGFYSNIASAANRYNFYANGTAANYFAGTIASLGSYTATTANAANMNIDSSGNIARSTSSIRYKKDVETLESQYADAFVAQARPVWYRSKSGADNANWGWYGLIAEEVAEIDPRLVHWGYPMKTVEHEPAVEAKEAVFDEEGNEVEPAVQAQEATYKEVPDTDAELQAEGVQYDRLTVLLLDVVKRQNESIKALEARVAALEGV